MAIRIVFADDHEIVRYGLCLLMDNEPDIEIVGQAANAVQTLDQLDSLHPDVLLLDLYMPGASGTSLIADVHRLHPDVKIVMMSGQAAEHHVRDAMKIGARAFVRKDDGVEELLRAVRAVVAGERYLSPCLAQFALSAYVDGEVADDQARLQALTDREREIIQLAAEGLTSAEIGQRLFISRRTVEAHRSHAMQKLGLRNEVELARFFVEQERKQD